MSKKVYITDRQLRHLIRQSLISEKQEPGAFLTTSDEFDAVIKKSDKDDDIESGSFISQIPPGTDTAFPVGSMGGFIARLTSKAGPRKRPKAGASTLHKGRDYSCPTGTPIVAFADGVVGRVKVNAGTAGNYMNVDHSFSLSADGFSGPVTTQYMHLDSFLKSDGDTVRAGEVIALSGATGNVTGPHLHFTFKIGSDQIYDDSFYETQLRNSTLIKVMKADELSEYEEWELEEDIPDEEDEESIEMPIEEPEEYTS
jgi:murein DD-endopeptidase MepM/ murein hydrolase activator NlpD